MSNYTIQSTVLNKSRVFILQKSELEKSLSPLYYSTLPKKLSSSKKLKEIAFVNPTREKPKFNDDDLVPYVGLPQTDEHSKSIIEVVLRPFKEVKGRNIIYPNELLFARIEPSVFNKKYILTKDLKGYDFAFTSTEFYVVKGKDVDNEYLLANFLSDYVYKQVEGKTTGSTGRRRLDTEVFTDLIFPFPEIDLRKKVSEIITKYFAQKQKNEAEADKLLSGIDDYLLKELGIKLPEPPENTLKNRMFVTTIKTVTNNRFDPKYYSLKYTNLQSALDNSKYKFQKIKSFLSSLSMGISTPEYKSESTDVPFILGKNLKKGFLDLDSLEYISEEINNANKSSILKENDILFSVRGVYIGKVAVVPKEIAGANIINNIVKFSLNGINPHFVVAYLNSSIGQEFIYREVWGGAQPGFTNEQIKAFPIPVPPLDKQKEIAEHITGIRQQAQQLKDKTNELLKKASEEIEEILLN